ncbi:MAG: 60S ribosomal export protein NMD3 [Candidatus Thermoplasmatota archaeon]
MSLNLCILCGRSAILYENLCESCFKQRTKLLKIPDIFNVVVCAHCNSISLGKEWRRFENLDEVFGKIIENQLEWNEKSTAREFDLKFKLKTKNVGEVEILAKGTILGLPFEEIENAKIELKKATCTACSKKFGGYYEAIVQIRSESGKLSKEQTEESLSFVKNIVERNRSINTFLTKYEALHEGLDFYLSTVAIGRKIATALAKKYNAKIKISRTLVTRRAGKNIYRVNFSVRLPR